MAKGGEFILPGDQLPDIFTYSDLNGEQLMIQKTAREFMDGEVLSDEALRRIESKDFGFSKQIMNKSAELGLLGVEIPEQYGGLDLGKITGTIVAENIARQGSFACMFLAHTGIATYPILLFGTEEQKKKYLPKLVAAEMLGAYALTEAEAGSDAAAIKTKAVLTEDGKHYVINGKKLFITNGGFADVFVVFAKVNGDDSLHSAFIVERSAGIETGKEEHKMGIVGSSTVPVFFTDVMVPAENLLGQPGMGLKIALSVLNLGRFKLAAACLGGARACLESALFHARQRKQFGKPLVTYPVIREKLATIAAYIYAMESAVYRTAGLLEESIRGVDVADQKAVLKAIGEFAIECSAIKVFCSDVLDKVIADENVQIHGGYGYIIEHKALCAATYLLNARINRLFEGTNEINRLLAVGQLLKKAMPKRDKEGNFLPPDLPLMAVGKKLLDEAMSPIMSSEPDDEVQRLGHYLNNAKKAVILTAGAAWEKFNFKLEEHQIVLMGLADCLIGIYILESVLAALNKNRNENDTCLAQLVFDEKLFEIETAVRRLVAMCAEGDTQRTMNAMVKRLLKFTPVNKEKLADRIVEGLA